LLLFSLSFLLENFMDITPVPTEDIVAALALYRCDLFKRSLERRVVDCSGFHGLQRVGCAKSGLVCDLCDGAIGVSKEVFSCRSCNFDVCSKCFRAGVPRERSQAKRLEQRLSHYSSQVLAYADAHKQARAREVLQGLSVDMSDPEKSIRELLRWFKSEFFRWTRSPSCPSCGEATSENRGMATPTDEELRYGGSRVESWWCAGCSTLVRFPRYADPEKLLQTRHGRCGEWANCFTLCVSALGFKSRLVVDWTDHVWTEVRVNDRWIHCDPCEGCFDAPLLYESGWGKKLTYVVAFSADEVVDVAPRYTDVWPDVLSRRTLVSEEVWLELIARADILVRASRASTAAPIWRANEEAELAARVARFDALSEPREAELCGRQSGVTT